MIGRKDMKQTHGTWYLIVAVSLLAFLEGGKIHADVTPAVPLSTSVATYQAAINAAINKPTFIEVSNACLPLSSAAPKDKGIVDLGVVVRDNWYRVPVQDLAVIRDGLTNAAKRLLTAYQAFNDNFALLLGDINNAANCTPAQLQFQRYLLSAADAASEAAQQDSAWQNFLSDGTNSNFRYLFMGLRKRRDFFRAAIDPTTLASSSAYRPEELQQVNILLQKPALPVGSPADGDIVAVSIDINGGKYFLQAVPSDTKSLLFATAKDPLDSAVQFKVGVDFDQFGLQLTTNQDSTSVLTADNVVADAAWLPAKKQKATRLGFYGAGFSTTAPQNVKFGIEKLKNGTGYILRSCNFPAGKGYLKVDVTGDLAVRVLDFNSTLSPDNTFTSLAIGDATPVTFVKITDLHRALASNRAISEVAMRIAAYSALLDGSLIATLNDFLLVVAEAQAYVDSCRVNAGAWKTFTDAGGITLMRGLIQKFRQNMVAAPAGNVASQAATIYAQQNNQISALEVSLNAGMNLSSVGGRFADGSSINNTLLVIAGPNGTMLRVGENGIVSADQRDFVDPSAQFIAEVDVAGNVAFKSVAYANKYLQAGQITTNVTGWLQRARFDISRASCLRSVAGAPEKFQLDVQGSAVGTYSFKNMDSQGYLRVDADGMLRSVDATNTGSTLTPISTVQSAFSFIQVDSFIKMLAALRLESQDKIRIDGYVALTPTILTDQHVNLLLQEVSYFVAAAIKSSSQWSAWKTAGLDKTLADWLTSAMQQYSNRSVYPGILEKLATGYVADAVQADTSGLSEGDIITFELADQQDSYIQVQSDGTCKLVTGAQFAFDPSAQFIVTKDANVPGAVLFKSAFLNNLMLRAPDVAVPATAAEDFLMDRLAQLSQTRVDGPADAAANFELVPVQVPGKPLPSAVSEGGFFLLKRKNKDGYLKVGTDLFVRFFDDPSKTQVLPPVGPTAATKLTYNVVTSLQKKFAELRGLQDDAAKIIGYRSLLKSIVTLGDLKNLLFELKYYIGTPRIDVATYTSFKNVQVPLIDLLTQISTQFANSLKQFEATVPTVDSLKQLCAQQLVQNINAAFASLTLKDKVAQLESLFASISNPDAAAQFLTLFDATIADRAIFPEDLLARMKTLYQSLILNDFTKADATLSAGTTTKRLDVWNAKLTATVVFADVLALLVPVAVQIKDVANATDDQKNKFVALAIALTNYLQTASDEDKDTAAQMIESAAYTYLYDRKANLVAIVNTIRSYVKPQNVPTTYSAQVDALVAELKALTKDSPASGMNQFIVNAKKLVDSRTQGLVADLTRLQGCLDDALWHPLVLNQAAVSGGTVRFDIQLNALIAIVKAPIPFTDLIQNLTDMLDKNPSFAESDVAYFMARAAQIVSQKGGQSNGISVDAAVKVLTRGSRYQVSAKRAELDQLISQLLSYKASVTGVADKTYIQKLNDLKSLLTNLDTQAASRQLAADEIQSFFDGLQAMVDSRLDGTPSQVNNLITWLSSSVVNTSRLVFSKSDGISLVQKIISVLQASASISDRVANLQAMLKKHPQFNDNQLKLDFIEKAQDLASADSRQQAASEKIDTRTLLTQILTFAKANQFANDTSVTTGAQNLDKVIAQLSTPLNQVLGAASLPTADMAKLGATFAALSFSTQISELDRGVSEIVDKATATTFTAFLAISVANRISATDADILRFKKVLRAALRAPGIIDDATKVLPGKINAALTQLDQPLLFSDYYNAVNVMAAKFVNSQSTITEEAKNLLVGYAQKLADNLISSLDQNARNTANSLLKKLAFNQLGDRSTELLKICDVIEAYVPSEQVGQKYTQAITALQQGVTAVTSATLSGVMSSLADLVGRRAQGVDSDVTLLKQMIDKLIWHPLVQNESGQIKLKALNDLMAQLNQPVAVKDLIKLLSDRLVNQSFAPDDVTYFMSKAQNLVDQKNSITDSALLTQAINLLNQASRYQMASKRSEIDQMVAILQTQAQTFTQQQYVSYGDRLDAMKTRLNDLDKKALAQQLIEDDGAAFMKALESLVGDRAQAVVANITDLSAWLTTAMAQSRLFFVTKGAKDRAVALLALLQQPVSYADQYDYLAKVLRDYPNFSSTQMQNDFFDKCAYLVSDEGKKQAVSEGFDYKKLADIFSFARVNQASGATDRIDNLVRQLNTALPVGQDLPKTYNDKLADLENAITTLQDTGSVLTDFVTKLEGMVTSRMYSNEAEFARLSQLLQKAQWNAVIRQSSQSAALLPRIQTALDALNKPVFFGDLAVFLVAQSKTPLTSVDDQARFVARTKQFVGLKEQAPDGSSLDQVITALKIVAFNQLQKNVDLQGYLAQLDAYRATIKQQVYTSFIDQVGAMQSRLSALDDKATAQQLSKEESTQFLVDLGALVNTRSTGIAADIQKLQAWLQSVLPQSRFLLMVEGAKDKVKNFIQVLQQAVPYAEQVNFISSLLKGYSTFSSQQMVTDFINKVTYLVSDAGKQQAVAENFDYKPLVDLLVFAGNNQLKTQKSALDALIAQLNTPLPQGKVAPKTYSARLSDQESAVQSLQDQGTVLVDFVTALEGLVADRLYGTDTELTRLSQLLQRANWSAAIRNSADSTTLLARIATISANLSKPVFFTDLAANIAITSKLPLVNKADQDLFISNVTKLVAVKEQATDPNALDQVITAIKVATFNQLQTRTELAPLIAQLDTYRGKMNQQAYVSFADQVAQIQSRLTDLDTKAKAQQLADSDAQQFLKDLQALIGSRASGIVTDIQGLSAWLTNVVPQSRLFFITTGAKDKAAALLATLAKPVSYTEQFNYLAGLLKSYTTFSSEKMSADVLAKCTYLVSDEGKKQAQAEGFDYTKLTELLTFAEQNQMLAQRDQVDALLVQLKLPIGGVTTVVKTFNDNLTEAESVLAGLTNDVTALTSYVARLETLVTTRLDASDAELARLNSLLQKVQWNAAIRGAANAATLLARVQAALDNLAKPVLFTDLSTYLQNLSKQPLTLPADQNRFIAQATKLVAIKDQATDQDSIDNVLTVFKLVAYNQLQSRTDIQPLIDQLAAYKTQVGQQTVLSFAQKIADLGARVVSVNASTVDKFMADLTAVIKGRFEASADQLKTLSDLANQTSWLNVVRTDKAKGYAKQASELVKEVARVPSVVERMQDLAAMLSGNDVLNEVLQDSFVQKSQQLLAVKANATSAQLITIIQTLKVAIFNQVRGRAQELQDILNTFTRYQQTVQLTGGMSFADRVKQLTQALPSLTEQALPEFRQQVSDLFDQRVDASDDDITAFKQLLQAAVWNNVVVGLKNRGNAGASDDFTNWYNSVDAPIDFIIWYNSLIQMLQADTLPTILQQQFMNKVAKLVAAIPRAQLADLEPAQKLLLQASYNQMSRYKSDLDLAVSKLKNASNAQSPQNSLSYSERIKAAQAVLVKLAKASTQDDIDAFTKSISDLVDQRVDAINDDLSVLQKWLMSNEVQNNEGVYFHQAGDTLLKLASALSNPVGYGVRVQNLTMLVQSSTSFTAVQKSAVMAKTQLLVDLRAQAATENYPLSDVVKMIQFIIDKRLDKTADAPLISRLNNAIYVLQSGSTGTLRLRYGQQIDQLKTMLTNLVAADIPKFTMAVKTLVDSRVDGTADQVAALAAWLSGADVQANKVLFFAPQKAEIQKMATTLQTLPTYADRYTNIRQLLQDYPVFDSESILNEFMSKAFTLVSERGRAAAEKLDLQYVKDLFVFALQNRLNNDATSSTTLRQYLDALGTPPDQAVATGAQKPYAQRITDLQAQFKATTQATFSDFVTALSQMVDLRVDATDAELTQLKAWLASSDVQNSRIVFLQGGSAQIKPLIDKLNTDITLAQRVDNLRLMIQNSAQFSSADQTTFFAKVDKIVAERWKAAQENINIEDIVKLLQFAQANQFGSEDLAAQSSLVTTKIAALRTAPEQQGPIQDYVPYATRITNLQTAFALIGSMQKDVATMNQFIQQLDQMVADRVDGSDTDRASLITFIRSRVLYHQLVYGITQMETALQKNIDGLLAPITYGERYASFKKMLAVSVYGAGHKVVFLQKLQDLADGRGDAAKSGVDLVQLVKDVTFAKLNKFNQELLDDQGRTAPDRNPTMKKIDDLITLLQSPAVATLTAAVAKVQAQMTNLSPENWAAASVDQKRGLLAQLRVLVNNVDESATQADKDAINVMLLTARGRVFKGDTASIALLNQYIAQVEQYGVSSAAS